MATSHNLESHEKRKSARNCLDYARCARGRFVLITVINVGRHSLWVGSFPGPKILGYLKAEGVRYGKDTLIHLYSELWTRSDQLLLVSAAVTSQQ